MSHLGSKHVLLLEPPPGSRWSEMGDLQIYDNLMDDQRRGGAINNQAGISQGVTLIST